MKTISFLCSLFTKYESSTAVSEVYAFCLECNEDLCMRCREIHSKFPSLKHHSIILYTHITAFPIDIINKTSECDSHPTEKAEFYCTNHYNTFYFVCLKESHRKCTLMKLSDVSRGVKLSNSFIEIQNRLTAKRNFMKNLINIESEHLKNMLRQKMKIVTEMSSYISRINTCLIDLVQNFKTVHDEELYKVLNDLEQLQVQEKDFCRQRDNIENNNYIMITSTIKLHKDTNNENCNVKKYKPTKEAQISIRDDCSGIARYSDSNFKVSCNAGGLMLIGTTGEKEKMFDTKELLHLNQNIFLKANEKSQVFCSFPQRDTILSIDYRGNLRFLFQSKKRISPRGVTGDGNSNIFVSGYERNNILWISNNGKKSKEVLNSRNGIQSPTGIDYDKVMEILAVCNGNGSQMSIYSMK
ncbi:unnamed protein product [Mytilus coruscus]|uniref:B box-type domain-containing protein n=1 Tax=Mytilus coruscus TaxID=42192 RepID=A0A6J8BWM2_MYTCO|nr:unnamed protein product [Mytilus coruscus]